MRIASGQWGNKMKKKKIKLFKSQNYLPMCYAEFLNTNLDFELESRILKTYLIRWKDKNHSVFLNTAFLQAVCVLK